MISSLKRLSLLLSSRTKNNILFILLSILIIGILEMLSVLFLMPLLTNIQDANSGNLNNGLQQGLNFVTIFFNTLHVYTLKDIAFFLVLFMILKHTMILALNYYQYKVIFNNDIWLRNRLLEKYATLNYLTFNNLRSSDIIRNTAEQVGQISYGALLSILIVVSELIVTVSLLSLIFFTIPLISSIAIICILLVSILPFYVFKKRMIGLSKIRFDSISKTIAEIQNLFHLHIEIKLYDIRKYFLDKVKTQSSLYSTTQVQYTVISNLPKGLIEVAAVLIVLLLVITTKNDSSFIPTIGIIVTSIFRITPSLTRISSSLTQFKFSVEQINILSEVMLYDTEEVDSKSENLPVEFEKSLVFKNINFAYTPDRPLLTNFNLTIKKQDFLILRGKSGKGKSTIIKIVMGFLRPQSGEIYIDDQRIDNLDLKSWHSKISYVPQKPVIIEGSLLENVCLGSDSANCSIANFNDAIKNAQLEVFNEEVGQRNLSSEGGSISGGQAQRISIARALYRQPDILILDEPTSALDAKNAELIISLLSKLNKEKNYTIVVITHSNEFDVYASSVVHL